MAELWHTLSTEEVFKKLKTSEKGLSEEEAEIRLKEYGLNRIKEVHKISPFKIFLEQLNSLLIYLLFAAALVSAFISHWLDSFLILAVVFINAFFGFIQQYRAERAINSLKQMLIPTARVMRQGRVEEIPAELLVPGDILTLNEGDKIMADARLFYAEQMQTNEAILTGESMPADKVMHEIRDSVAIGDRINMVFLGTNVERGTAKAVVTATGMATEFGRIALMVQQPKGGPTPLQQKLNLFSKQLGMTTIIIMLVLLLIGILAGIGKFEMFLTSVSLAVAAIPEGLPAVITLCLAFAVKRMLKVKALIRKLPAAETLGRVTVICSDKTGTITREELKVVKVLYNSKIVPVNNQFLSHLENSAEARLLLKIGCMSSNARLEISKHEDGTEKEYLIGDGTEKALLRTAKDFGFNKESLTHAEPRIKEFAFSSERKMMSIIRRGKDQRIVSYAKGSPEVILQRCNRWLINGQIKNLDEETKNHLLREYSIMAAEALRVIAFAYKFLPPYKENVSGQEAEYGLIFVGFQGIFDAPREEVKEAIEKCEKAGIAVKMITGDSLVTAKAVARQIGLKGEAIDGRTLKNMNDTELLNRIEKIAIFARVDPADKVRVISILKQKNEIVASTGDGINDAPALKKADIGIAMGVRGSDVTREVADIVLLDDHFATIVRAVEEGRRVYDNIKKFTYYMLSTNIAEIFIVFFALLLGIKLGWQTLLPLVPLQILWVNLVSDSIIAISISRSPAEKDIMHRNPERMNIVTWKVLLLLLSIAVFITAVTLTFFARYIAEPLKAQTVAFTMLVLFEGFNAFNFSSFAQPAHRRKKNYLLIVAVLVTFLLQLALIYLPFMQEAFHTTALTLQELIWLGMASVSILVMGELYKIAAAIKKEF